MPKVEGELEFFTFALHYIVQKQLLLCPDTTQNMGQISLSQPFQIKYIGEKYFSSICYLEMEVLSDEALFQLFVLKLHRHFWCR